MPGQRHPRVHVQGRRQGCELLDLRGELIENPILSRRRQRHIVVEVDLARLDRLAQLAERPVIEGAHRGEIETGRSRRHHAGGDARALEPARRRQSLRHDAVALDREGHARRRLERGLQPFQHERRIERLIGRPVADDACGIDPRLAQRLLRIDRERIAQAGDLEVAVALRQSGDHDAGLGAQPCDVAVPKSLVCLIDIAHPRQVETGCPRRQKLAGHTGALEPRRRRRSLRHDAAALDRERHALRRIERRLEPLQHDLRIEGLIGRPARGNARRIDPHLAQHKLRVYRERIAQARDQEFAVAPPGVGDHDAGLRPQPRDIVFPQLLVLPRPNTPRAREHQHHRHPAEHDQPAQADPGARRRLLPECHAFGQLRFDIRKAGAVAIEALQGMVALCMDSRQHVAQGVVQALRRIAADHRDQGGERSCLGPQPQFAQPQRVQPLLLGAAEQNPGRNPGSRPASRRRAADPGLPHFRPRHGRSTARCGGGSGKRARPDRRACASARPRRRTIRSAKLPSAISVRAR